MAGELTTLYSDFIAAYGTRARDLLVEMGTEPQRIFCTGAPAWDTLFQTRGRLDTRECRSSLGLDPDRPVVVFLTSYNDGSSAGYPNELERRLKIHEAVANAVRSIEPCPQLVIRPHPNELWHHPLSAEEQNDALDSFAEWARELGHRDVRVILDRKIETIGAADLVLVETESAASIETIILERPVIVIPHFEGRFVFSEQDGILFARPTDLPRLVARLLASPEDRDAVRDSQRGALQVLHEGDDGAATQRVVQLICKLAARRPRTARFLLERHGTSRGPSIPHSGH